MESLRIRNFFWSQFSRIWTEHGDLLLIDLIYDQFELGKYRQGKIRIRALFREKMVNFVAIQNKSSQSTSC